jgi:hypothetical protein
MHVGIDALAQQPQPPVLIAAAGFEDRAARAAQLISERQIALSGAMILTYSGPEHEESLKRLSEYASSAVPTPEDVTFAPANDFETIQQRLRDLPDDLLFVIDITGMARHPMLSLLSWISDMNRPFWLVYTEAEQYYPTEQDLNSMLGDHCLERGDLGEAFFKLAEYEEADLVYSANCLVEEVDTFPGRHLPNYPLLLIAFLTFKRSRLSAVLREYEASSRILIEGVPVRADLQWRKRAMELINFDLMEEYRRSVETLNTLDWRATRDFLEHFYWHNGNCFRHNILLAPLGSKMQTVGAWAFARRHGEIKMITSTPQRHFPEKYSMGWRDTFVIDDLDD